MVIRLGKSIRGDDYLFLSLPLHVLVLDQSIVLTQPSKQSLDTAGYTRSIQHQYIYRARSVKRYILLYICA